MENRRDFIKKLGMGSLALSGASLLSCCNTSMGIGNVGFIAGIVKKELANDWRSTLMKTAELGYKELETNRFFGTSEVEFLSFLKEIGMRTIAGGTRMYEDQDDLMRSLDGLNALEMKYAVIYWPWLVGAPFSLEDCKISADLLNRIGEICQSRGLKLCWHNHAGEFNEMEEGLPFDYLMDHTDPGLVSCEMDVYWVKKGGADPVEYLRKYSGRYPILHLKDMIPGQDPDFACVGAGIVDFPAVLAEAKEQGIQHFFVEKDRATDGMACLESAFGYLDALRF